MKLFDIRFHKRASLKRPTAECDLNNSDSWYAVSNDTAGINGQELTIRDLSLRSFAKPKQRTVTQTFAEASAAAKGFELTISVDRRSADRGKGLTASCQLHIQYFSPLAL